jgi:hypothetical protein
MTYYHISLFQRYGIFCIWMIAQASCVGKEGKIFQRVGVVHAQEEQLECLGKKGNFQHIGVVHAHSFCTGSTT